MKKLFDLIKKIKEIYEITYEELGWVIDVFITILYFIMMFKIIFSK